MNEVQRADPGARRLAIALVVLSTLGGLLLMQIARSQLPALEAWITDDPSQLEARLELVTGVLSLAFGVPSLLGAVYFWRLGWRIVHSGRFPAPGTSVIRDTPVLQGSSARRRGRALQVLALILALAVVGVVMMLWRLASLVISRGG